MRKIALAIIAFLSSTSYAQKTIALFKPTDNKSSYNSPLVLSDYNETQNLVANAHMSHAAHASHYSCQCKEDIIKEISQQTSNSIVKTVSENEYIKDYVLNGSQAYIKDLYQLEDIQFSKPLRCLCVYILTYKTGHEYYIPLNRNNDSAYFRAHYFGSVHYYKHLYNKRKKTIWMKELVNRVLTHKLLTK